MYAPRAFARTDLALLDRLLARDPFVTLISPGDDGVPAISHLPVLYRRDELVRSRRGTALAYTHTGICSACNIHLQPMLFQKLKRGEGIEQCPSCNRLIYFRAVVPAGASESSDA